MATASKLYLLESTAYLNLTTKTNIKIFSGTKAIEIFDKNAQLCRPKDAFNFCESFMALALTLS